jgi:hypothetical protein
MKVAIVANNGDIAPADTANRKRLLQLLDGEVYDCVIDTERIRSNPQNARYWAMLHKLSDLIPESMQRIFSRAMLEQLTLENISSQTLHEYIKLKVGVKSIAFDQMDHIKACAYYTQADEEIAKLEALALSLHKARA